MEPKLLSEERIKAIDELTDLNTKPMPPPDALWHMVRELLDHADALEAEVAVSYVGRLDNFGAVWEAYALADDDTLDSHALELKQRLLRITGVEQLGADLVLERRVSERAIESLARIMTVPALGNVVTAERLRSALEAEVRAEEVIPDER